MHGPSIRDMTGLALISISWLAGMIMIVRDWKKNKNKGRDENVSLFISIYPLSCVGIGMSLKTGFD